MTLIRKTTPIQLDLCGLSSDIELSSPVRQLTAQPKDPVTTVKAVGGSGAQESGSPKGANASVKSHRSMGFRPNQSSSKKPCIRERTMGQVPDFNAYERQSSKRLKSAEVYLLSKEFDRKTAPFTTTQLKENGNVMHIVPSVTAKTTSSTNIVQSSLDTVTQVIATLGQKLSETEHVLREAEDRSYRLELELVAERQSRRVKDAKIARLERELGNEKKNCQILEDAQKKLDQIQALCGGLGGGADPGLKRELGR